MTEPIDALEDHLRAAEDASEAGDDAAARRHIRQARQLAVAVREA